jgi:hypothetical protein
MARVALRKMRKLRTSLGSLCSIGRVTRRTVENCDPGSRGLTTYFRARALVLGADWSRAAELGPKRGHAVGVRKNSRSHSSICRLMAFSVFGV